MKFTSLTFTGEQKFKKKKFSVCIDLGAPGFDIEHANKSATEIHLW